MYKRFHFDVLAIKGLSHQSVLFDEWKELKEY